MTKTVRLSDEAYRRLTLARRPKESLSDVVVRLTQGGLLSELSKLKRSEAQVARHLREIRRVDTLDRP